MGQGSGVLKSMVASPRPGDAGSLVPASAVARSPAPLAGQELETEGRRRTRPTRSWGRRGGGGSGRPGALDGAGEAADPVKMGGEEGRRSGIEWRSGEEGGGSARDRVGCCLVGPAVQGSWGGVHQALYRGCCDPNNYSNPGISILMSYIYIYLYPILHSQCMMCSRKNKRCIMCHV